MTKNESTKVSIALFAGILIGSLGFGNATAEETPAPTPTAAPVPQGNVISVCIDKKTGVIRAVSTCKKTERSYVLGGPGPIGPKGDVGPQGLVGPLGTQGVKGDVGPQGLVGPQGVQGTQGMTGGIGPTGSVSGLRSTTISVWEPSSIFGYCDSFGYSALSPSTSLSQFGSTISLTKSCINFSRRSVSVYAP
jgi:hypothetical protein